MTYTKKSRDVLENEGYTENIIGKITITIIEGIILGHQMTNIQNMMA